MSKMGRVVQDIMERFNGNPPAGYTLTDYFRDVEKDRVSNTKSKETKDTRSGDHNNGNEDASQS